MVSDPHFQTSLSITAQCRCDYHIKLQICTAQLQIAPATRHQSIVPLLSADASMNRLTTLSVAIQKRYDGLSRTARTFLAVWLVIQVALLGLLWYITPKRVFEGET
jgi:hypothetical protein